MTLLHTLQIDARPHDAIAPYARNPKQHGDEQIAKLVASLREFGWTFPILTDEDGEVIAGHGRLLAAQRIHANGWMIPGWPDTGTVPVLEKTGLTDAQKRAYRILDNRVAEDSGWDDELLALELDGLADADFDVALTGLDADEIDALRAALENAPTGNTDDPDSAPEAPAIPISRQGDIWVMGRHRVMCGDSTSIDSVQALMAGSHADLLVTDPPYNVAYEGKTADALTIENDAMADGDFRQFLRDCYATADAVMRPGAAFYIWHADSEGFNFRAAAADVGWKVRQCLIWNKSSMVMGRQDYHWKHEPCLYGWKDGAAHGWYSDRKQTTVLNFDRPMRNGDHPTMKPVDLICYQVENSSKPGHTVLDLFGGSGSTLIACDMSGRAARLMEIDPKYCDVIVRRWQEYNGGIAHLEGDGRTFDEVSTARR